MIKSAGLLVYRNKKTIEFLLVHPGGPFWKKKEAGAWSIPKGEFTDEMPEAAARREFIEETGWQPEGLLIPLQPVKMKSGKFIFPFAMQGDFDPTTLQSNFFEMEWPYRSGKKAQFPEVDKAGWFSLEEALELINPAQASILTELAAKLREPS